MKKSKVSKLMLMIAVVAIVCCISGMNYAANLNDIIGDVEPEINDIPIRAGDEPTTNPPVEDENNIANQGITPIGENTINSTRNITANTNTALPKAGANDTFLWGLIAVSAVAAIYTYKKVRDYTA